jgi:glucosamine--fructose-6-phosphate aminotransferase (isomerizing)
MDSKNLLGRDSATFRELMSQPVLWQKVLQELEDSTVLENIINHTRDRRTWLFVGCGTSYYLAETAAAFWRSQTGQQAFAVPASEVMLFPDKALLRSSALQSVVISRSGETSEAVKACQLLRSEHKVPVLGITCGGKTPLEANSDLCVAMRVADEKSPVMTRSFTSMLLSLQHLAARLSGDKGWLASMQRVATHCALMIEPWAQRVEAFVEKNTFANYAFLGQGPLYGIAREGALKLTEMSCSFGQPFHTLEFRHGPKATVTPETCLTFYVSETGNDPESKVLSDMKELGGTVIAVCRNATSEIVRNSDLVFEFEVAAPEMATLAPFVIPSQLLGFFTGVKKGLTPDAPRNLSRVVMLD